MMRLKIEAIRKRNQARKPSRTFGDSDTATDAEVLIQRAHQEHVQS